MVPVLPTNAETAATGGDRIARPPRITHTRGPQCSVRCAYCFHRDIFTPVTEADRTVDAWKDHFTVDDYITWRDIHINSNDEIFVHFHGGEPLFDCNIDMKNFMDCQVIGDKRYCLGIN